MLPYPFLDDDKRSEEWSTTTIILSTATAAVILCIILILIIITVLVCKRRNRERETHSVEKTDPVNDDVMTTNHIYDVPRARIAQNQEINTVEKNETQYDWPAPIEMESNAAYGMCQDHTAPPSPDYCNHVASYRYVSQ